MYLSPIVKTTKLGSRYLQSPGIVLLAKPMLTDGLRGGLMDFMSGFSADLGYKNYLDFPDIMGAGLTAGEQLCKIAGQACYLSFGARRTMNAEGRKYFKNIIQQGHESVLEHANYTFLFYGVSRSCTHELVRHRHFSYSQVSQRYVGADQLRFVERPEFLDNERFHAQFVSRIDLISSEYRILTTQLRLAEEAKAGTATRKKIQQAARAVLTNEVEAPIIVTGNIRAWRHFFVMRGSEHAEPEIQRLAVMTFTALYNHAPAMLQDITIEDGTLKRHSL